MATRIGYHATKNLEVIKADGWVRPFEKRCVHLFRSLADAVYFRREFLYDEVVCVSYDTRDVARIYRASYAKEGGVVRLKEERRAKFISCIHTNKPQGVNIP